VSSQKTLNVLQCSNSQANIIIPKGFFGVTIALISTNKNPNPLMRKEIGKP
jgi:hypothetical protein